MSTAAVEERLLNNNAKKTEENPDDEEDEGVEEDEDSSISITTAIVASNGSASPPIANSNLNLRNQLSVPTEFHNNATNGLLALANKTSVSARARASRSSIVASITSR